MLRIAALLTFALLILGRASAQTRPTAADPNKHFRLEQPATDVERETISERQLKNQPLYDQSPNFGNLRQRVTTEGDISLQGETPLIVIPSAGNKSPST